MARTFFLIMMMVPLLLGAWLGSIEAAPLMTERQFAPPSREAIADATSSRSRRLCSSRSSQPTRGGFAFSSRSSVERQPLELQGCGQPTIIDDLFGPPAMDCGPSGWTFPGLIQGSCPVSACILKGPPNVFGGPTSF